MLLTQAIEEFLLASSADGLRRKTLIWYGSLLKKFSTEFHGQALEKLSVADLRRYLNGLRQQKYSADTLHGHTRALHRFWRWCATEYEMENPMLNIKYPKQPKPKLPKAITPDDVIRLLDSCEDNLLGKRNKAMIAFLADTGCRAAGLCSLRLQDLIMDTGRAYVVEKGDKRRVVMFTEVTSHFLRQWIAVRATETDLLFHNRVGDALTPNGLLQMLYDLKAKAGISGRVNPHSFRHGFARAYLLNGGDLATLSRLMGHEDVSVTASFYGVFAEDELAAAHRAHSNLLKIKMSSFGGNSDLK